MQDKIKVMITSADMPGLLSKLIEQNLTVEQIQQEDDITYTCMLDAKGYKAVCDIMDVRGDTIKSVERKGLGYRVANILHRPILAVGVTLLIALSLWLPMRVFFVEVTGNVKIPDTRILEEAAKCGIYFGASRKEVRSEQMKNKLLSSLPELQWAGINTYGCVAEISVKEKSKPPVEFEQAPNVSSIVASRDGVITSCVVQKGNQLCEVGNAVKAGQTLVSGYTDCGLHIRATEAQAEITADTMHNFQSILPTENVIRLKEKFHKTRIRVLLGKKLINFSKDSGILDAMCVKMYKTKYLTLPGGRTLPVALVMEESTFYETTYQMPEPANIETMLENGARTYLISQMISGQILDVETVFGVTDGYYYLQGQYICNEIIGQALSEERFNTNGENF